MLSQCKVVFVAECLSRKNARMSTESAVQVDRHAQAAEIISSAAAWSAAAGAVPLPLLDLVAVGTVQGKMVADLARLYGEQPSKELARGWSL